MAAGAGLWHGRRVLVTGAGGFIGSHLVERLVAQGARVRALVHYRSNGSWGWLDEVPCRDAVEVKAGDVRDRDSVAQAVDGVEVVFHLAALIGIPYSYEAPGSYVDTNITGTLNVLQACRAAKVQRVVQTSTSEVYGTARQVPIAETHPLQGQSPYAATKIGADKLAESFHHAYGLPVTIVRPFNTFGPRQSTRAVIPTIITQCLAGQRVRLGNLRPTRDLNYVDNTVDGFLSAAAHPDAAGRTFNVGSGREISIGDLAGLIARLTGRAVTLESDDARIRRDGSEVDRLVADSREAQRLLGWVPAVTLEDGLQRTIDWMQSNLDRYRSGAYAV